MKKMTALLFFLTTGLSAQAQQSDNDPTTCAAQHVHFCILQLSADNLSKDIVRVDIYNGQKIETKLGRVCLGSCENVIQSIPACN